MRRLIGCLTLLLLAAVLLVLVVRGPGLAQLPVPSGIKRLAGAGGLVNGAATVVATSPPTATPAPTQPVFTATPLALPTVSPEPASSTLTIHAADAGGAPLATVIDGNALTLTAAVDVDAANLLPATVAFSLKAPDADGISLGSCRLDVQRGGVAACTLSALADGWAWQAGKRVDRRTVYATLLEHPLAAELELAVTPKPVVLVHGFTSNAATWSAWTGPGGFLADWDVPAYAVGDGQFGLPAMDTGDFGHPRQPTGTLADNAAILARYVEAVRETSGAERVDLVAHSMGGLISRYYVSNLMPLAERPGLPPVPIVNQLYMIGTPNAGTQCAVPPAALGLYAPATTQLTPTYIQYLFNPRTADSRGVPFFVLAGDPVQDYAALVCTPVPTDVFVSVASAAGAIPVNGAIQPVRHGQQTKSPLVFATVLESLARDPAAYPIALPTAPAVEPSDGAELQVSLVDTRSISPGESATVAVPVDDARAASFQVYAAHGDLELSLLSATGDRVTAQSMAADPRISAASAPPGELLATQGLRVADPRAGQWQIIVTAQPEAQKQPFAVAAFLESELRLSLRSPNLETTSPTRVGEPIALEAVISGPLDPGTAAASVSIRDAQGRVVAEFELSDTGDGRFTAAWEPVAPGLYTISATASGRTMSNTPFQRLAVLAVEIER
jgi:pimeloyl-ACP methyl ester carboxylesterase